MEENEQNTLANPNQYQSAKKLISFNMGRFSDWFGFLIVVGPVQAILITDMWMSIY